MRRSLVVALFLLLPAASNGQEPAPKHASGSASPGLQSGPSFWTLVTGVASALLGAIGAHFYHVRRSKKEKTIELHLSNMLDKEFLYHRMKVQKMLFADNSAADAADGLYEKYRKVTNFAELRRAADVDDWISVAAMGNFFRTLNAWGKHDIIDKPLARKLFGELYAWWWFHLFEPFGTIPQDEYQKDWSSTKEKITWLLDFEARSSKDLFWYAINGFDSDDYETRKTAWNKSIADIKALAKKRMEVRRADAQR